METSVEKKTKKQLLIHNITTYNLTKEKIKLLCSLFKAMAIDFKIEEPYPYGPEFEKSIERGEEDIKNGRTSKLDIEKLWNEEHGEGTWK